MPTYTNTETRQVIVDGVIFKASETIQLTKYLKDTDGYLTLDSDTPFYNPVISDVIYSGSGDSTTEIDVSLDTDFIYVVASSTAEIYRNDYTNLPPRLTDSGQPLRIDNRNNAIRKIIIRFTDGSSTNVQITLVKDEA